MEDRAMSSVTIKEAQAKLTNLIPKLGPGEEIVITENNKPVAKLVSERAPVRQRPQPGLCKGMIRIVADDEDHLKDFAEYIPPSH
jgi:prevent-host-death family protein